MFVYFVSVFVSDQGIEHVELLGIKVYFLVFFYI